MSEDHNALLSQISQLAGQINRRKNQLEQAPRPASAAPYPGYTASRGRGTPYWPSQSRGGYASWGGRGRGRGAVPIVHRNKTLVVNNKSPAAYAATVAGTANAPASPASAATGPRPAGPTQDTNSAAAPTQWVAKRDRHMQLINSSVYEQHVQSRTTAANEALREGLKRKEAREKVKLNRVLQDSHGHPSREITLGGERYAIAAGGNKLVKLSDAGHSSKAPTPKKAIIGGIRFQRSRNGNLVRSNVVRASRLSQRAPVPKSTDPCKYYSSTGQCKYGLSCTYVHDPTKVAICPRYLSSGACPDGDMCDLSHEPTPNRVPACHHFLRGNCVNSDCRYAHIRVNPGAAVCRPFATLGYCPKGAECTERHVYECPDYNETGTCTNTKCKLPHIEHAGKKRAAAVAASAEKKRESSNHNSSNESSDEGDDDEGEEGGSDDSDVDSDILPDFDCAPDDDGNAGELLQDFIKF